MTRTSGNRLYQKMAVRLMRDLAQKGYKPGDRIPAERDLTRIYDVSRSTVREAIIALEVQCMVEVRVGSGAYLFSLQNDGRQSHFNVSAFELTEARLLLEGEIAALAATTITAAVLARLEELLFGHRKGAFTRKRPFACQGLQC